MLGVVPVFVYAQFSMNSFQLHREHTGLPTLAINVLELFWTELKVFYRFNSPTSHTLFATFDRLRCPPHHFQADPLASVARVEVVISCGVE